MTHTVYIIEGIDRLGKSTLIKNIKDKLGFFQVIHFGKPEKLKRYTSAHLFTDDFSASSGITQGNLASYFYQSESFRNAMLMCSSGARLIFDRSWLGEAVYSSLYRGYSGDYVFDLERRLRIYNIPSVRLILLTEDFSTSKHFQSDGESFDDDKREMEQGQFIAAYNRSAILDRRIVCVTGSDGRFRPEADILKDAIS